MKTKRILKVRLSEHRQALHRGHTKKVLLYMYSSPCMPLTGKGPSGDGGTRTLAKKSMGSHADLQPATEHECGLWSHSPLCTEPHTEHTHTLPHTPPYFL